MKRSPRWHLIGVATLVTVMTACTVGSGDLSTTSRNVSDFDEILLLGSGNVHVDLTGSESLVIEADDNLLPILTSEVINGRLELGSSAPYASRSPITYSIPLTRVIDMPEGIDPDRGDPCTGEQIDFRKHMLVCALGDQTPLGTKGGHPTGSTT